MAVPQTHRVPCVQASGEDDIKVADTSNEIEKCFQVCRIRNTNVTPPTNSSTEQNSPIEDDTQPQLYTNTELNNCTVGYCEVRR